jgi:hypothetical protein
MRLLLMAAIVALIALSQTPSGAQSAAPVVVELFTSEGCSSCPPADQLLERLTAAAVDGAKVVALGEHVDYWDRLGWRDRFSSAAFTNRQELYARRFNLDSAYTPQMVVDGHAEFVGSDAVAARRAIAKAAAAPHGTMTLVALPFHPSTSVEGQGRDPGGPEKPALHVLVNVSGLPPIVRGDRADILVAVTEDALRSDVKSGENRGRTLRHAAVVRQLTTIGEATGPTASAETTIAVQPGWQRERLNIVAFVQQRRDRGIVAAASVPLIGRP